MIELVLATYLQKAEIIDFSCQRVAEAIMTLELKRQFCAPPNTQCRFTPDDLAALKKLEEWWERSRCSGDKT